MPASGDAGCEVLWGSQSLWDCNLSNSLEPWPSIVPCSLPLYFQDVFRRLFIFTTMFLLIRNIDILNLLSFLLGYILISKQSLNSFPRIIWAHWFERYTVYSECNDWLALDSVFVRTNWLWTIIISTVYS